MWRDRGTYWEHTAAQGTPEWLDARIGRVNGSDTGSLGGHSSFDTPEQTGKYISGAEQKEFSERSQTAMAHGHKWESVARDWYATTSNVQVVELGLCVSKSDIRIGASVDGVVVGTPGIIEIKCPQKMYRPIQKYQELKAGGWQPPDGYHDHIWRTHYCQMQQAMWVLCKQWCDYIVYSVEDRAVFTQRFTYDSDFIDQHLKKITENYERYVKPHLRDGYPIVPC